MSNTCIGGGCSCGRTRYQLTERALIVHACHCRMCQRLTGSTNAVNILIEAENMVPQRGETFEVVEQTPSGEGQVITRCRSCYSAIWSEYNRFTSEYRVSVLFVRAGTLDHPEICPPDVHIYTESKQPHLCLGDDKPAFRTFYDPRKVWSTSSLARIAAAASVPFHAFGTTKATQPQQDVRSRMEIPSQIQKDLSP